MYFTINPSLYYAINEKDIKSFVLTETNENSFYILGKDKLVSLINIYLSHNSCGINEDKFEDYINYICNQLVLDSWNK